jgi:hypothetical protein
LTVHNIGLKIPCKYPLDALHRGQDFQVSGLLCFQQGASVHECELFAEVPGVFVNQQVAFLPCAIVLIDFVCGFLACGPEHMGTVDTGSLSLQLSQQNNLWQAIMSCAGSTENVVVGKETISAPMHLVWHQEGWIMFY